MVTKLKKTIINQLQIKINLKSCVITNLTAFGYRVTVLIRRNWKKQKLLICK